ncbi:MAG: universal stress protein [Synergistaceae bacterium]|nr:universal stress protein [Synergistaceae bacterium]
MFNKFIVATDLSDDSLELIGCVDRLKAYGAQKCLLIQYMTVNEVIHCTRRQSNFPVHKYEEFFMESKQSLIKEGFEVQARVLAGYPVSGINKIAVSEEYSLIATGARRSTSSGEIYFSPLANELMHVVSKPLLIMRSRRSDIPGISIDGSEVSEHLLYPTDFSDNADMAFSKVLELASGRVKKVTLLHVQDAAKINPHLEDKIEEFNRIDIARLEGMKKLLQEKGAVDVDVLVKYGSPAAEIINTVEELGIQLVVMGSQGRGYVKEFFLGSVSGNVARRALSSVLIIPAES